MRKRDYIFVCVCIFFISCISSDLKEANNISKQQEDSINDIDLEELLKELPSPTESETVRNNRLRDLFVLMDDDSLLYIPFFVIPNLYGSSLERFHEKYNTYEEFKDAFLHQDSLLDTRKKWSYHVKINKSIMNDFNNMSTDVFLSTYITMENEKMLVNNDTTLAYCLDIYGYNINFNEKGKAEIYKR